MKLKKLTLVIAGLLICSNVLADEQSEGKQEHKGSKHHRHHKKHSRNGQEQGQHGQRNMHGQTQS